MNERNDYKFIEPIKGLLPWRSYRNLPIGKEKIVVIYTDGRISCNYAISYALIWCSRFIAKWCYYNELITKRYIKEAEK